MYPSSDAGTVNCTVPPINGRRLGLAHGGPLFGQKNGVPAAMGSIWRLRKWKSYDVMPLGGATCALQNQGLTVPESMPRT